MNTFIKYNNLTFSVVFAILAIVEICGYVFEKKTHCLFAAVVVAAFAVLMFVEYKKVEE